MTHIVGLRGHNSYVIMKHCVRKLVCDSPLILSINLKSKTSKQIFRSSNLSRNFQIPIDIRNLKLVRNVIPEA